jgi:hypothetical protein
LRLCETHNIAAAGTVVKNPQQCGFFYSVPPVGIEPTLTA